MNRSNDHLWLRYKHKFHCVLNCSSAGKILPSVQSLRLTAHTLLACSVSRKGSNQNDQGCCNFLIASFCSDTTQNIVPSKLVTFLSKNRYGQKGVLHFIFSASGWNIRFSWDTNIMRTVVCVRARYRSFLLTGTINFYESLNMHIAHNTTACAQNKYTHRHIESLSQIKL